MPDFSSIDFSQYLDSATIAAIAFVVLFVVGDHLGLKSTGRFVVAALIGVLHHYQGHLVTEFIGRVLGSLGM